MPDREHRSFWEIRPSIPAHRHDFRGRPNRARVSIQQQGAHPRKQPVDRAQVLADKFERGVDRSGQAVSTSSVKIRRRNRAGVPL